MIKEIHFFHMMLVANELEILLPHYQPSITVALSKDKHFPAMWVCS